MCEQYIYKHREIGINHFLKISIATARNQRFKYQVRCTKEGIFATSKAGYLKTAGRTAYFCTSLELAKLCLIIILYNQRQHNVQVTHG